VIHSDYIEFRKQIKDTEKPLETDQKPEEEQATEERKTNFQPVNKYDQIIVQDKVVQLLPYEMLSELIGEIVFELLLNAQKIYPKKTIETKFEKMMTEIKDSSSKLSLIETQKILEAIHLVDTSESPANAMWIGPDCINLTGVTHAIIKTTKNIEDVVVDHYRTFKQNFPYEINQRESSFFLSIYNLLCTESKTAIDKSAIKGDGSDFKEYSQADAFDKIGFAALKNKSVNYVIDQPIVIIGSSKIMEKTKSDFSWEVDLDLFPDPYVSKQHALIAFNFQTEKFEIRCLSTTNPIKVKDKILTSKDDPRVLDENCFIRIGKQTLWFTITNEEEINNEEIEEN
jgi:hypothetical protein